MDVTLNYSSRKIISQLTNFASNEIRFPKGCKRLQPLRRGIKKMQFLWEIIFPIYNEKFSMNDVSKVGILYSAIGRMTFGQKVH